MLLRADLSTWFFENEVEKYIEKILKNYKHLFIKKLALF